MGKSPIATTLTDNAIIMKRNTIALFTLICLFLSGNTFAQKNSPTTTDKFAEVFNKMMNHYVDSVDGEDMVDEAIVHMLEALDPHSVYIPADEVLAMNEPLKGNFDGIGVRFQMLRDTLLVVNPIPGGPSEKLGIMAGDKMIAVEGESIAGVKITNKQIMEKLRGKRGTKVNVTVLREGEPEPIPYTITRDKIPIHSIEATYMATPEIGYIKLNRFAATSHRDFKVSVEQLKADGMQDLILDLRGNGGGYLRTAIDLCDELLSDKKLVVYTEGVHYPKDETYTRRAGVFEKGKLVILIDESSASASEILSGAVQDWDRGLIVGRRSFGKGLVQKPMNLEDGSQIRLTISRYYTPSGRSIQKSYEEGVDAYRKEKYDRANDELFNQDSIAFPDSLKYKTNRDRLVYGGGGIMPDLFVAMDTSYYTDYYSSIIRKGTLNSFCLEYVNKNRKKLNSAYPDFGTFNAAFTADEAFMEEFFAYAEKKEVDFDAEQYEISKNHIAVRMKAQLAANIWDYAYYYQVINTVSPEFQLAIEALQDNTWRKMNLANVK